MTAAPARERRRRSSRQRKSNWRLDIDGFVHQEPASVQAEHQPRYENLRKNLADYFGPIRKNPRGDPNATDEAILKVVDSLPPL
jgi:hypothetical protein